MYQNPVKFRDRNSGCYRFCSQEVQKNKSETIWESQLFFLQIWILRQCFYVWVIQCNKENLY